MGAPGWLQDRVGWWFVVDRHLDRAEQRLVANGHKHRRLRVILGQETREVRTQLLYVRHAVHRRVQEAVDVQVAQPKAHQSLEVRRPGGSHLRRHTGSVHWRCRVVERATDASGAGVAQTDGVVPPEGLGVDQGAGHP